MTAGRSRRMMAAILMACAARISRWLSPSSSRNSIVAPSSAAAFFASAILCLGEPYEPASPREQTTRCALRPACVSRAMTAPQPNSMSSGCAPKARSGLEFGPGFIGAVDFIARDKSNFRCVFGAKIFPFAETGNVMRAVHQRLHPAQAGIARRRDLFLGDRRRGQRDERIAALVQM